MTAETTSSGEERDVLMLPIDAVQSVGNRHGLCCLQVAPLSTRKEDARVLLAGDRSRHQQETFGNRSKVAAPRQRLLQQEEAPVWSAHLIVLVADAE